MKIRRTGLWLSAALIGFFAACRHNDLTPAVPDGYIELKAGTTVPVVDGISVVVDTASASICPRNGNASCFAPDNVYASVRLVKTPTSQRVRLFNFFGDTVYRPSDVRRTDSTRLDLAGQSYKVILKGQYIGEKDGQAQGRPVLMVSQL